MMFNCIKILTLLLIIQFGCNSNNNLTAQTTETPILFIYDASGSMWGKINGEFKKDIASDVLALTIDQLGNDQKIGLIAYGHSSKSDCKDVELLVDLQNKDKSLLVTAIKSIKPLGKTPLAYSAEIAIKKIKELSLKATIILVTDGVESCNGDLCKVIQSAKKEGIAFKLHIVGFGLKDNELAALKCASAAGEGNYYDAKDADQLARSLESAVNEKVDDPVSNHSFYTTKNGMPVDAWIKVKNLNSGLEIRGVRTYQDTAQMYLPIGEYTVTINPLGGTDIESKTIKISKTNNSLSHNTISFDGGNLEILISNNGEGWDATIKVYRIDSKEVVAASRTYGRKTTIEVNAGDYNINVMPLHIKGNSLDYTFKNIGVIPNKNVSLNHDYKTGIITVGVQLKSGELIDAVVKVIDNNYVTGFRTYNTASSNPKSITIAPGVYEIKISTLGTYKGTSKTDSITVTPGNESTLIFKID